MCLKCAIDLGIPDIFHKHGRSITLSELIKALNINQSKSHYIDRVMRVLVHAKFFSNVLISDEQDDSMGFRLVPANRPFLIRDNDFSMVSFIGASLDSGFTNQCQHGMSRWFQNQDPTPFWTFHGRTFWDHLGMNPELNRMFNESRACDTRLINRIVPGDCKKVFDGLDLMMDVGGGTGYMSRAITNEFPNLKSIVLDLPQVVDGLKGDDKVTFFGGNMFESIPPCDAVFLKWILHNWNDDDCLKILKKCKEAIDASKGEGGKVIIIDMVVGDEEDHKAKETKLLFDMLMMVLFCAKEITEKDWAKLFSDAGFTSYKITPLLGLRSLIEVFP